jgi:hypothetical protein
MAMTLDRAARPCIVLSGPGRRWRAIPALITATLRGGYRD